MSIPRFVQIALVPSVRYATGLLRGLVARHVGRFTRRGWKAAERGPYPHTCTGGGVVLIHVLVGTNMTGKFRAPAIAPTIDRLAWPNSTSVGATHSRAGVGMQASRPYAGRLVTGRHDG